MRKFSDPLDIQKIPGQVRRMSADDGLRIRTEQPLEVGKRHSSETVRGNEAVLHPPVLELIERAEDRVMLQHRAEMDAECAPRPALPRELIASATALTTDSGFRRVVAALSK